MPALRIDALLVFLVGCTGAPTRPVVDTHFHDTAAPIDTDTDSDPDSDVDTVGDDLDGVELAITWTPSGVSLGITGGSGEYRFGMAGTGAGAGGWYGEDCLSGEAGYVYCHAVGASGGDLSTVAEPHQVVDGTSTLFDENQATDITYAVWSASGACRTWGDSVGYYKTHGCRERP